MFERHHEPMLSRGRFALRMLTFFALAVFIDCVALAVGAIGFRCTEGFGWLDCVVNSAMIITGNGPIDKLTTTGGKLFASGNALLGEALYVIVTAVLLAPIFHRLLHWFHMKPETLEQDADEAIG